MATGEIEVHAERIIVLAQSEVPPFAIRDELDAKESPAVSCMSGSSNLNSFRDRRQVAVQLVSYGVLPPGLVQDCSQHSCVIAV